MHLDHYGVVKLVKQPLERQQIRDIEFLLQRVVRVPRVLAEHLDPPRRFASAMASDAASTATNRQAGTALGSVPACPLRT